MTLPPRIALLCALALLATACSSGTEGTATGSPSGSSAPAAAIVTDPPEASAAPDAGRADKQPAVTDGGKPAPPPPPVGKASQNDPPVAGTYSYRQEGGMSAGGLSFTLDPEGTLEVLRAALDPKGQRQRSIRRFSDTQEVDQTMLFARDAVFMLEMTQRFAGRESRCEPDDPLLVAEVPLTVGATWNDSGACSGMTLKVSAKVLRTEQREVGGQTVETVVVRYKTEATGDGFEQTSTRTAWIAPSHRLVVRSTEKGSGKANGIEFTSETTEDLVSLIPA